MAEKWMLIMIDRARDELCYYAPESYVVDIKIKDFIATYYPGEHSERKISLYFGFLTKLLLNDGWEPFSVGHDTNSSGAFCLRIKV
jgi:hypothetical protein